MKRTKRVHVEGWVIAFTTEPIMERVARYLDTRELFPFLLAVSKVLRDKATKTPRWNQIMEYERRLVALFGKRKRRYKKNQNVLNVFVKSLYSFRCCSLCLTSSVLIYVRPFAHKMGICMKCGKARGYVISNEALVAMYCKDDDDDVWMRLPLHPVWLPLDHFKPDLYHSSQLVPGILFDDSTFRVMNAKGQERWRKIAK
jgi:hypothetical protein